MELDLSLGDIQLYVAQGLKVTIITIEVFDTQHWGASFPR